MVGSSACRHPKSPSDSFSVITQVVLPNDANPLGFILGGTVMHLIDIAGAMAASRHSRTRVMTAAVDGLQFLHPIPIGDIIILEARATCAFTRSLEIQVDVFGESTLHGHAPPHVARLPHVRGGRRGRAPARHAAARADDAGGSAGGRRRGGASRGAAGREAGARGRRVAAAGGRRAAAGRPSYLL